MLWPGAINVKEPCNTYYLILVPDDILTWWTILRDLCWLVSVLAVRRVLRSAARGELLVPRTRLAIIGLEWSPCWAALLADDLPFQILHLPLVLLLWPWLGWERFRVVVSWRGTIQVSRMNEWKNVEHVLQDSQTRATVRGLQVTNDAAERGVALIQTFQVRTKDEQQKQFLIKVVHHDCKTVKRTKIGVALAAKFSLAPWAPSTNYLIALLYLQNCSAFLVALWNSHNFVW